MKKLYIINKIFSNSKYQSFLRGFMYLFDPAGLMSQKYRTLTVFSKNSSFDKDFEMLSSDWINIGIDIQIAIEKFGNQYNG